jgi:hypothetical protein
MTLPDQARAMAKRLHSDLPTVEDEWATMDEAAALLVSLAEAMEWRPMDSVPKEAEEVLLWIDNIGARPAYWADDNVWRSPVNEDCAYEDWEILGWREPLPAPPASTEGEKG